MILESIATWGSIPIYRHQLLTLKLLYNVRIATLPTIASTPFNQWVGKDLEELNFSLRVFTVAEMRLWRDEQNQISNPIRVFSFGDFGASDWVLVKQTMSNEHINYMTGTGSSDSLLYQVDVSVTAIRESF